MPSKLLVAALLMVSLAPASARSSVILSELCDPQNNFTTDRFIEIYNTGPGVVDLTGWTVIAVTNTTNTESCTWTLSGTIAAGQAKVCGGPSTVTGFTVHFPSATWATTAGYMNWNGNIGDGARLKYNGGLVDEVRAVADGLFKDADLVRKPSVTSPTTVYDASQWTSTPVTLATDASPGTHNGSAPPTGGPVITSIVTDPATPLAGVPVNVEASVVDTVGSITTVTLAWGLTSSSQPNVLAMALLSGSTYRTSTPIPAHSTGATVYYKVQADGTSGAGASSVLSYTLSGSGVPPTVVSVGEMSDSTLLVFFSEPVEESSAETPGNYTVGALVAVDAVRDPVQPSQVLVTVRNIPAGPRTLTVNGVADLSAEVAFGATRAFTYIDVSIPAGYYDSASGLHGSALRVALHNIIKNHNAQSYGYAFIAFQTSDVKPNGKVWDVYSDVPGGTPPYEYDFDDQGQGAAEGAGFNREHSWPQSWFNESAPMHDDLWILYPTDAKVNGYRANLPYGDVGSATITSLNGSKVGANISVGYSGTVFEPIDAYKGDMARSQFYVATRYFNEDAGWDGSPSASGANLVPWAADLYMQWTSDDPVSWKERLRNGAIWVIQNNRNPFVDHPEFVAMIYDSNAVTGVGAMPTHGLRLRQNLPNPFGARTTIGFDLARREHVTLRVYDVTGRMVRTLTDGSMLEPGSHQVEWNGRDDRGASLQAGLYFCRLGSESGDETRRMVLAK